MKILSKIKKWWNIKQMYRRTREKVHEEVLTPLGQSKAMKSIDCIIHGHQWSSEFDATKEIAKPLHKRVYCKHCGVYYHTHVFKNVLLWKILQSYY